MASGENFCGSFLLCPIPPFRVKHPPISIYSSSSLGTDGPMAFNCGVYKTYANQKGGGKWTRTAEAGLGLLRQPFTAVSGFIPFVAGGSGCLEKRLTATQHVGHNYSD